MSSLLINSFFAVILIFNGCSSSSQNINNHVDVKYNVSEDRILMAYEKDFHNFMSKELNSIKKVEEVHDKNKESSYDRYINNVLERLSQ